jgi:hypothetical protein
MKKSTIIGLLAFGSTVTYLFLKSREGDSERLQGIEIKINPRKLVDGALAMSNIHPTAKDGIRTLAHNAISKYYGIEE